MKGLAGRRPAASALVLLLLLSMGILPALAAPIEKDLAFGDEDFRIYGAAANEVIMFASTATGDVNGDGLPDLVMGHDRGGAFYTGKVYVYYGRRDMGKDVDLGTRADVTITGYYGSFSGNSVACGDINNDGIDDIVIGAWFDSPGAALAGGVGVVFGSASLPAAWDFNAAPPDLYLSGRNGGEYCGLSVACGDIDGDGCDDILSGAPLGNGGVHFGNGTAWTGQGSANADALHDVSMIDATHGWAVGKYLSSYDSLYYFDGTSWDKDVRLDAFRVDFNGVAAFDAAHVWAVGGGGTIAFRNGAAWASQDSRVTTALRGVAAASASDVWAVGDGGTIRFYDGSSWTGQASGTAAALRGVAAASPSVAWAVGDAGTILATTDGGATWSGQTGNTSVTLRGVTALNASTAWAVGDAGTILKTTNGGATWTRDMTVLFSQDLHGVDALSAAQAWTVGEAATGRAYITWGRAAGWPAWTRSSPIPPNKVIDGVDPGDYCGIPVSAGNLNGDTFDDMVIGAPEADGPGNSRTGCGEAYVVKGRNKGAFPYFIDLAGGSDCTIYGGTAMDGLPSSLRRPLRDINGDRFDDILFGVCAADGPGDSRAGCGEVDAVFGGSLPAAIDLAVTAPDLMVYGAAAGDGIGFSVDALDFNGDRLADLATGSPGADKGSDRANCGAVWVVSAPGPWPERVDLAASAGLVIYGREPNAAFGFALASANLDGDTAGRDDLVGSSPNGGGPGNARPSCGEHFVFLGYDTTPPTCAITNLAAGSVLAGTVGIEVSASDHFGIGRVDFAVNGQLRHSDTEAPYRWDWDTREKADGTEHVVKATAYDIHGNSADDSRRVRINNTIPPLSRTWYLAEGTTAWGFEEYVLVQNPNAEPTEITVTFMRPGGAVQTEVFPVAENSRFTIPVNNYVDEDDVSTRVDATLPIICERSMYWGDRGGGHDSIGVVNPSPVWYLAEGTTAWGFEEYILVQNPNPDAVDVTMTFMQPGGAVQAYGFPVAGQARFTLNVAEVVGQSDVSTKVEATAPVICERAMYRYDKGLGHATIGTPSTSREWYLAEGTTAWGFEEYVLIQNPNDQQASVGVEFMLPDGTVVPYGVTVPGQSRFTIHVDEVRGCEQTDLSTCVKSSHPVICERAMYWQGAASPGGHATIGTPLPSTAWFLAEGTTAWGFEEYILVQNPNDTPAVVSFTFMKPDATTEFFSVPVAANSRFSLKANDLVPDSDISTSVLSDIPVICERAMYWGRRDVGTVTIGVRGER